MPKIFLKGCTMNVSPLFPHPGRHHPATCLASFPFFPTGSVKVVFLIEFAVNNAFLKKSPYGS